MQSNEYKGASVIVDGLNIARTVVVAAPQGDVRVHIPISDVEVNHQLLTYMLGAEVWTEFVRRLAHTHTA